MSSNIEWTDETWEVTAGCTKVSRGCTHCYAETLVGTRLAGVARKRAATGRANGSPIDLHLDVVNNRGQWNGTVVTLEPNLAQPLRRREPTTYFVNSRSDLFHPAVPFEFIDRVFAVMALCPQHTFQVLTKRPERMAEYLLRSEKRQAWAEAVAAIKPLGFRDAEVDAAAYRTCIGEVIDNVWLGTSVEDQAAADARIPHLLRCPAAVRFLSCEPLLGPLVLPAGALGTGHRASGSGPDAQCPVPDAPLHWVIVGGESGPGARPCNVEWIRGIVRQCREAGVACFVKQLGANVRDRNDAGFDADEFRVQAEDGSWHAGQPGAWPSTVDVDFEVDGPVAYQGQAVRIHLENRKGVDPAEWPEGLRVREWPDVASPARQTAHG